MKTLIISPTYNEIKNAPFLVDISSNDSNKGLFLRDKDGVPLVVDHFSGELWHQVLCRVLATGARGGDPSAPARPSWFISPCL